MARYVDADKLLKSAVSKFKCVPLVGVLSYRNGEECFDGLSFEEFINEQPTADVAPRSEVEALEKEIDRLKNILAYYALQYGTVKSQQQVIDRAKSEVAREIFEEIERVHDECIYIDSVSNIGSLKVLKFERMLEELKQKYTEEQK